MPADQLETLKQARENFVRKRRTMAEQMIPLGAAAQHFAPAFADLQASIEAIDRAIADEEKLPEGYAAAEPEAWLLLKQDEQNASRRNEFKR